MIFRDLAHKLGFFGEARKLRKHLRTELQRHPINYDNRNGAQGGKEG